MNKKAVILLAGGVLAFFISFAQDYVRPSIKDNSVLEDKKFTISISAGPAIPLKDFSSTNVKNSFWDFSSVDSVKLQGFAKIGSHLNVTASYLFSDDFGVMMVIGNNANSFDIATFNSTLGYPLTTTSSYHTREFLIGPYFSISEWERFRFEASALIGLVTTNYPELALTNADTTLTIAFNKGRGFGYSLGGGVKYSLNNKIDLSINIAYTQAKMVFPGWTQTFTIPGYYPYVISHPDNITTMSLGIVRPTVGIVFSVF